MNFIRTVHLRYIYVYNHGEHQHITTVNVYNYRVR